MRGRLSALPLSRVFGFLAAPEYRFFLGAAVLDFVTSAAFVFFARRARLEIEAVLDRVPIPRPGWK